MVQQVNIHKVDSDSKIVQPDLVAVEEPLEIQLVYAHGNSPENLPFAVVMRTPGHDMELAIGLLLSEGIIYSYQDVDHIWHCQHSSAPQNTLKVRLKPHISPPYDLLQNRLLSHAGCGICGKSSIEKLKETLPKPLLVNDNLIQVSTINLLNGVLLSRQITFRHTGGLHAAALFDCKGQLQLIREDIGRHNALDKLIGANLAEGKSRQDQSLVFLSSRIGFELVQKILVAGIPILAAVGAPTSLSIQLADQFGLTLIGFVRDNRFNVYTHPERLR